MEVPSVNQPAANIGGQQANVPVSAFNTPNYLIQSQQDTGHNPNANPVSAYMQGRQVAQQQQQAQQKSKLDMEKEQAQSAYINTQAQEKMQQMEQTYLKTINEKWGGSARSFVSMYDRFKEEGAKNKVQDADAYAQQKIAPYWQHFVEANGEKAKGQGIDLSPVFDYNETKRFVDQVTPQAKSTGSSSATAEQKNFELKNPDLVGKAGTTEYAERMKKEEKEKLESKANYQKGRRYAVFNLKTGKMEKLDGGYLEKNPGSTLDAGDADVKALSDHEKYSTGIQRFVNRVDTLGKTIEDNMQKNGLNQGGKYENWTMNQIIGKGLLSKGDVIALEQQLHGLGNELGKLESGSIGVGGATVESMKQFNIPLDIPLSEFRKYLKGAQSAGKSVTDAMTTTKQDIFSRIYEGTNIPVPKHITKKGNQEQPANGQKSAIDQLKEHALAGDAKAQSYLKQKGIAWQQ